MSAFKRTFMLCGIVSLLFPASGAFCRDLPTLARYGTSMEQLITPETHLGTVMEVYAYDRFSMREKTYLILQETEINGVPAGNASFTLRKGQKVKAVVYRLKNKAYFVSDLTLE